MKVVVGCAVVALAWAGALGAAAQAPDLDLMDIVLKSVPDGPVAVVNGEPISAQAFKDLYMGEVLRWAQLNPGSRVDDEIRLGIGLNGLRMLIEREILYQEALKRKISIPQAELEARWKQELDSLKKASTKDGEAEPTEDQVLHVAGASRDQALEELRKAMLIQKVREAIMKENGVSVSEKEVADWYAQNRDLTKRPDMMHLKQIFIQADKNGKDSKREAARKRAEEAYKRILSGQSFEAVAKSTSDGRYKEDGGDWGTRPVDAFPPFIVNAANKLKPGEISEPIESDYGYHILKLVEVVPGEEATLEKAEPEIRRLLLAKKGAKAIHEFTSKVTADPDAVKVYLDLDKQIEARPDLREKLSESTASSPDAPPKQTP